MAASRRRSRRRPDRGRRDDGFAGRVRPGAAWRRGRRPHGTDLRSLVALADAGHWRPTRSAV